MIFDRKVECPTCGLRYHSIIAAADCCRVRREEEDRKTKEQASKRHAEGMKAFIEEFKKGGTR